MLVKIKPCLRVKSQRLRRDLKLRNKSRTLEITDNFRKLKFWNRYRKSHHSPKDSDLTETVPPSIPKNSTPNSAHRQKLDRFRISQGAKSEAKIAETEGTFTGERSEEVWIPVWKGIRNYGWRARRWIRGAHKFAAPRRSEKDLCGRGTEIETL